MVGKAEGCQHENIQDLSRHLRFHKEDCPEDTNSGFLRSAADRTPFPLFLFERGSRGGLVDSHFLY